MRRINKIGLNRLKEIIKDLEEHENVVAHQYEFESGDILNIVRDG